MKEFTVNEWKAGTFTIAKRSDEETYELSRPGYFMGTLEVEDLIHLSALIRDVAEYINDNVVKMERTDVTV